MPIHDLHVHLESHQEQLSWRGSLATFARANSLTPGQIYELYNQLEKVGEATLSAYGANRYTLRKEGILPRRAARSSPTFR
jgi:hypothetical protein